MKTLYYPLVALFTCLFILPANVFSNIHSLPNGVVFRVDIGTFEQPINTDKIVDYQPVSAIKKDDKVQYHVGAFTNFLKAQKARNMLKEQGFKVDVVAYFNSKPIALDDAFVLMNNMNKYDEKDIKPISTAELNALLDKTANHEFYYTIQIGLYKNSSINDFFDLPKTVDETITERGEYRYTYGTFSSYEEAVQVCKTTLDYGMKDALVVAIDDSEERIPLSWAINMEEQLLNESLAKLSDK
jgi:hypothetical protein